MGAQAKAASFATANAFNAMVTVERDAPVARAAYHQRAFRVGQAWSGCAGCRSIKRWCASGVGADRGRDCLGNRPKTIVNDTSHTIGLSLYQATVAAKPTSNGTFGFQLISCHALPISGCRRFGSPFGNSPNTAVDIET